MELEELMNILKKDVEERETLLSKIDKENPLYIILENTLYERKEKYEIVKASYDACVRNRK